MCWYDPAEEDKRIIKNLCVALVKQIKDLEKDGDPIQFQLEDVHTLIDHLYSGKCKEKKKIC